MGRGIGILIKRETPARRPLAASSHMRKVVGKLNGNDGARKGHSNSKFPVHHQPVIGGRVVQIADSLTDLLIGRWFTGMLSSLVKTHAE